MWSPVIEQRTFAIEKGRSRAVVGAFAGANVFESDTTHPRSIRNPYEKGDQSTLSGNPVFPPISNHPLLPP